MLPYKLISRWKLSANDEMYERLCGGNASDEDAHEMLQLWRKINANNMLYRLGKACNVGETSKLDHVDMPAELAKMLHDRGSIVYPLRLADIELLGDVAAENASLAPLLEDMDHVMQQGFVTISHVWVDGKLDVKAPLCERALDKLEAKYVWIDKICINQRDEKETSSEIPKLKDYFKVAPLCLLAAPNASNESINDMDDKITQLWKFHEIIENQTNRDSKLSHGMITNYREKMDTLIGELSNNGVLHHQWFTRIWTLPEMSVTRDLIISNGSEYAYMTPLIELIQKYSQTKSREMFTNEGIGSCLEALRMAGGYAQFTLSEALEASVGRTCSQEQDKIHALVGMVPSIASLEVRYDRDMRETLSLSCKLAYKNGDMDWILNTDPTYCGLPIHGTRFLCPLKNDKLWLNRECIQLLDTGIELHASTNKIESWVHVSETSTIRHLDKDMLSEIRLSCSLLTYSCGDIRDLIKSTGWIGIVSSNIFTTVLTIVFSRQKPESNLSVILPHNKDGITTVFVGRKEEYGWKKVYIGRSIVMGKGGKIQKMLLV